LQFKHHQLVTTLSQRQFFIYYLTKINFNSIIAYTAQHLYSKREEPAHMNRNTLKLCAYCIPVFLLQYVPIASSEEIDSNWLMYEDFENGVVGWQEWFRSSSFTECLGCEGNVNNPARILLTNKPNEVHSGKWAVSMPAKSSAGYQGANLIYRSCKGPKKAGCTLTGYERLYFRIWVKLAEDHKYVHHFISIGGTRPDKYWESEGVAGCRPNGYRSAGVTLDFNKNNELFFYTYYPKMTCDKGGYCSGVYAEKICTQCAAINMPCSNGIECCWGNIFNPSSPVILPRGEWVCLEMMMQLNTVGNSDGEMAFWINDSLALHVKGMRWRNVPELQLNQVQLQHYIESGDATQSNQVWFDDLVVSTKKIGSKTTKAGLHFPTHEKQNLRYSIMPTGKLRLTSTIAHTGKFLLDIYDIMGRSIWSYSSNNGISVDWTPRVPGLYMVHLQSSTSSETKGRAQNSTDIITIPSP
jgi:hypothetical protein